MSLYEVWLVAVDKERIPTSKIVKLLETESVTDALGHAASYRGSPANDIQVLNVFSGNWVDSDV